MLHPLEHRIRRVVIDESLLAEGSRLLIGVSGGADSMALMQLLAALQNELSLTLVAAYIDHGLRPDETPAEGRRVREAARDLGIACDYRAVDVTGAASTLGISPEHAAREMRYRAFAELAAHWATDRLAVAHTADDQVEEVLLRLLRGGGRKALGGMRLRSGNLIRPLLGVRKAELLDYLAGKGVGYCHDSSNDNRRFLRNRIRLDLLPLLEAEYDPGCRAALLKAAANLSEDEDLLERLLAEQWDAVVGPLQTDASGHPACRLNRAAFRRLHPALQRRLIEQLLWRLESAAQHRQILAVLDAARTGRTGAEIHLSRGLRVVVHRECLEFSYPLGKGPWRGHLSPR